jgi:uncharacterized membrane protein
MERTSLLPGGQPSKGWSFRRLRNYLMAGVLVSTPAFVTLWVFYRFFLSLDGVLSLLPSTWEVGGVNVREGLGSIPGLGAILTVLCIVGVGFLTTNLVGRRVVSLYEALIKRVPVLSTIYQGVKQLLEAVFSSDSSRFSEVVYIEYPRKGIWSIGFVTGPTFERANDKIGYKCVNVFVPTTPNPTSGFYLLVPRDNTISAELTVEQAFKLIMSAGIVSPEIEAAGEEATAKSY